MESPHRDVIQLTAFVVVLGTLLLQGLTLRPLLQRLALPRNDIVDKELLLARQAVLQAAMGSLEGDSSPQAESLRKAYAEDLGHARSTEAPRPPPRSGLQRRALKAARTAVEDLRSAGTIGDEAYRRIEEDLDWRELSTGRETA